MPTRVEIIEDCIEQLKVAKDFSDPAIIALYLSLVIGHLNLELQKYIIVSNNALKAFSERVNLNVG